MRKILNSMLFSQKLPKQKVFCVGNNKTGTTSLEKAMRDLGYKVGNQNEAERLYPFWAKRNFDPIISYCKTADFFQDIPFSKSFTFIAMDQAFKGSKFILTVRDSPEQWYNSLVRYHTKLWGKDGRIPNKEDLMEAVYLEKGLPWEMNRMTYDSPEDNPYQMDILIDSYVKNNKNVIEYFRHRPDDLLVLNIGKKGAYKELCDFLGIESTTNEFPWLNKTSEI